MIDSNSARSKTNTDAPIVLRPMRSTDEGRIITDWVETHYGRTCDGLAYKRGQWKLVKALIQCCPVLVAAYDKDPDVIFGWACTSTDAVHYVWVDKKFRRNGVAKELLSPYMKRTGVIYTHAPSRMWQTRGDSNRFKFNVNADGTRDSVVPIPHGWTYNPYHAFELAAQVPSYRE